MKVRATQVGYDNTKLRQVGEVFEISDPKLFSKRWMEPVDGDAPKAEKLPKAPKAEK